MSEFVVCQLTINERTLLDNEDCGRHCAPGTQATGELPRGAPPAARQRGRYGHGARRDRDAASGAHWQPTHWRRRERRGARQHASDDARLAGGHGEAALPGLG